MGSFGTAAGFVIVMALAAAMAILFLIERWRDRHPRRRSRHSKTRIVLKSPRKEEEQDSEG